MALPLDSTLAKARQNLDQISEALNKIQLALENKADVSVLELLLQDYIDYVAVDDVNTRRLGRESPLTTRVKDVSKLCLAHDNPDAFEYLLRGGLRDISCVTLSVCVEQIRNELMCLAVKHQRHECLRYFLHAKNRYGLLCFSDVDIYAAAVQAVETSHPDGKSFRTLVSSSRFSEEFKRGDAARFGSGFKPLAFFVADTRNWNKEVLMTTDELREVRVKYARILVRNGHNVDGRAPAMWDVPGEYRPLGIAVELSNLPLTKYLISTGVDPHIPEMGKGLVHRAFFYYQHYVAPPYPIHDIMPMVKYLAEEQKVNVHACDHNNRDAFYNACVSGIVEVARYLHRHHRCCANITDKNGYTPLETIAFSHQSCDREAFMFLLEETDANVFDPEEKSDHSVYKFALEHHCDDCVFTPDAMRLIMKKTLPVLERCKRVSQIEEEKKEDEDEDEDEDEEELIRERDLKKKK